MSSVKMTSMLFLCVIISACSLFEPFIDRRRNAGQTDITKLYVGRSTPDAPAVCSNGLWTSEENIQVLADAECVKQGTGTHAVKTDVSHFTCKLLLPTHTYFKCEK
ncbi:MAG: hypothetical protein J5896_02170 [Alphaproteobacteria bacterium]|nr:hypothetical protein [Alphaproteobacteria bacterium]